MDRLQKACTRYKPIKIRPIQVVYHQSSELEDGLQMISTSKILCPFLIDFSLHAEPREISSVTGRSLPIQRTRNTFPALRVQLQQIAPEDNCQRDKGEEDQPTQPGKKQELFVAVGAYEL